MRFTQAILERQAQDIATYQRDKNITIPDHLDFSGIASLSNEIQQKLQQAQPKNLADAATIQGITPAALLTLLYYLKKQQ